MGGASITNCLWDRASVTLDDDTFSRDYYFYNNLLRGGTIVVRYGLGGIWRIKDNLFDQTTITQSGSISNCYNGYVTGYSRLSPSDPADVLLTNAPVYRTNFLGNFYYPTNDGMLSTLINAGSRNATNAGLYHYTVSTNLIAGAQIKETNSIVDIGFHYVAVNSSGNCIDTDSDGLPDYFEDTDGDGSYNSSIDLSDWHTSDTDGDDTHDYQEYLRGRNPRVADAVSDTNNVINFQVYTPLK